MSIRASNCRRFVMVLATCLQVSYFGVQSCRSADETATDVQHGLRFGSDGNVIPITRPNIEPLERSRNPDPDRAALALPVPIASKESVECGANALFFFLRLNDADADVAAIKQRLPIGEHGVNLLMLKAESIYSGVPVVVAQTAPAQLSKLRMPLIARLAPDDSSQGHFVVVTGINERENLVTYIDGSNGDIVRMSLVGFGDAFAGQVIVREKWYDEVIRLGLPFLLIGCVCEIAYIAQSLYRRRLRRRT